MKDGGLCLSDSPVTEQTWCNTPIDLATRFTAVPPLEALDRKPVIRPFNLF